MLFEENLATLIKFFKEFNLKNILKDININILHYFTKL